MIGWCVYMLRCADGTLYTGITNDVEARVRAHNRGAGAKYTAARRPVELVWSQAVEDRREASRIEARIKKLERAEKLAIIETRTNAEGLRGDCDNPRKV